MCNLGSIKKQRFFSEREIIKQWLGAAADVAFLDQKKVYFYNHFIKIPHW
jgi:hypothetical protein